MSCSSTRLLATFLDCHPIGRQQHLSGRVGSTQHWLWSQMLVSSAGTRLVYSTSGPSQPVLDTDMGREWFWRQHSFSLQLFIQSAAKGKQAVEAVQPIGGCINTSEWSKEMNDAGAYLVLQQAPSPTSICIYFNLIVWVCGCVSASSDCYCFNG